MSSKRKKKTATKKPPLKKKKKKDEPAAIVLPPTTESTPNPSLPDDLLISCFARVSILYYPTLSLVSKSFRSLIASPELYKTRSSIGHTEISLYVCLKFHPDPIPRWFTLCRKPNQTITTNDDDAATKLKNKRKKKPIGYALAKIQAPHSGSSSWSRSTSLVTIGSEIYNIGGPIDDDDNDRSSNVSILDCRSNTWREGPNMLVKRAYTDANVVDGKIYVAGGCSDGFFKDCDSPSDWMEVFDPKTQAWEIVPSQGAKICGCKVGKSAGADGKLYMFGDNGLSYEPRTGRWEYLSFDMDYNWVWFSFCVVGDVLYMFDENVFKWYDGKAGIWRVVKGMKGLPKIPMVVLWERVVAYKEKLILCAVIALERLSDEEIWGKVEWYDTVLTVDNKSCRVEYALGVTV
ncbi:unnamed protein product [Microthlaspi erraticum]|uniref:F-box domain-containing protein n=1 Tax=Microthlaspi erraticum TaxID=1685480 RepID=A0A6D2K105_9BRAS|nr:unnamed protein product [Microthlaspi erraticum]CAA7043899.1 unnamed protein product [Microthlaspi erraticum]